MIAHMPNTALVEAGDLEAVRRIGRGIADIGRLRILAALRGRELCVCHLVDLLGLDASTVSRHVKLLRDAGLVTVRRDGRWLHCRRAQPRAPFWRVLDRLTEGAEQLALDADLLDPDRCC